MTAIQMMLHAVSILMFAAAGIQHSRAIWLLWRTGGVGGVRGILMWAAATGGFLALAFIAIQIDLMLDGFRMTYDDLQGWSMLVFGYLLALYLLLIGEGVVIWARWTGSVQHRRRWYEQDNGGDAA